MEEQQVEAARAAPLGTNVFVVSHSNIMQCGVALFELQDKVDKTFTRYGFDFGQNMWTMTAVVDNMGIRLMALDDGAEKPAPNAARGGLEDGFYPDTYVNDSNCAENSTAAAYVGRVPGSVRSAATSATGAVGRAATSATGSVGRAVTGVVGRAAAPLNYAMSRMSGFRKGGALWSKEYLPLTKFTGIEKPCFASAEKVAEAKKSGKSIKNKKPLPEPINTTSEIPFTFHITRHANSCNNIVPDKTVLDVPYLKYKRADPSLSAFGLFTLFYKRPPMLDTLKAKRTDEDVNVSSCMRTWMTAAGIYGKQGTRLKQGPPLKLVVCPFLKEKGDDPGNLPEPIPSQVRKFESWIKANMKYLNVTVWVASPTDKTKQTQIYPIGEGAYSTEHTSYYPAGIHLFCDYMVTGKAMQAEPEQDDDDLRQELTAPPPELADMYSSAEPGPEYVENPLRSGGTRRKHKSRRMKKSNRKKSRRTRRSRRS